MSNPELSFRRITSIPPWTSLDVLRGRVPIRIGGGSLPGGTRRVSREPTAGEPDWSRIIVDNQVFQRPPRRETARPRSPYERDGRIEWEPEVIENHDNKGGLGIIVQFAGIRFTGAPFLRGRRHYGPGVTLFYSIVGRNKRRFLLLLSTCGDICETQVVPRVKDVDPLFREELHLPQLTTTHDPTSMTLYQKNGLVVVSYNPRTQ